MERTIILYHGGCLDGFGGSYAAWKKFGDSAEYIPLSRSDAPPVDACADAILYFIDFTYPKEIMDQFVAVAKSVTVLDHHEGMRDVVEAMPAYVFDSNRSGAGIAWDYFHEGTPRPTLLNKVEDDDLFRFALPDTRPLITYLELQPQEYPLWDDFVAAFDDESRKSALLEKAHVYREYFEKLADISVETAKLVSFEGYEVYFGYTHPLRTMKSLVGNLLAKKQGPLALVVSPHPKGYGVSIRGDGTVDVAKIAEKFGGNGHPSSAGFHVPAEAPLPWTLIEDADSSN
jgi:oligoribonuclease NrnB/cAMP/cGMP phosphodiesterase (DHH superfamily)